MADTIIEGGCFCGEVRYRATTVPNGAGACHCKNCRQACAAPFVPFVSFGTDNLETDKFRFIKGKPIRHRYTSEMYSGYDDKLLWSEWWFCGRCGTQLVHIHEGLTDGQGRILEVEVTTCSLDDPNAFPPQRHSTEEEKLSWVRI